MGMIGYYYQADDDTVRRLRDGAGSEFLFAEEQAANLLDIGKAWHAIHFVLTGAAWEAPADNPAGQAVFGGEPVNDEDLGYGPMRLIPREQVPQIADALEKVDEAAFRRRFDVGDMAEQQIYPIMDADDEDEEEFFAYVWGEFAELKKFYRAAAAKNRSVIAFIA